MIIYNVPSNISTKYGSNIYFVYEYNYKYDNKSKVEYSYEDILNYTVSKIMDIISKYAENENIDKLKLLISLLDDESYEQNKNTGYREFNFDENQINKNDLKYLLEILAEIEAVNINIYVHRESIKNS